MIRSICFKKKTYNVSDLPDIDYNKNIKLLSMSLMLF